MFEETQQFKNTLGKVTYPLRGRVLYLASKVRIMKSLQVIIQYRKAVKWTALPGVEDA